MDRNYQRYAASTPISVSSNPYIEPHCDEFHKNPFPTYKLLQLLAPVQYWNEGSAWLLTRYDDVAAVQSSAKFSQRFKDWRGYQPTAQQTLVEQLVRQDLHALNAADNARLGEAVRAYFSGRNIEFLQSIILEICNQKLFRICHVKQFDLIDDYAYGISIRVIARSFAIPDRELPRFVQFARAYIALLDPGQTCTAVQLQQRLADLTAGLELIKQAIQVRRQVADGPYLIDHLIRLCDDERRLNDSELVSLIAILAGEGLDTSRLLIANTVFNLLQQPAAMTLLQAYPALWPNAVKEVLRFDFPVKLGTPLYALEDYPIDGKVITRGERVYPVIAAAHRDPEIFHRPDEFDITRSMTAVLDGDLAAHTFIGLNLARVEAEVAAQRLFAALPELRMVAAPTYDAKHKTLRAMTALPLVFADGAAAGFCR